jgi:hypothetical protein
MRKQEDAMARLWLLKGPTEAPGWQALRTAHEEERVDIVHLDPQVWALIRADEAPTGYDGLTAVEPMDGLYLDPNGSPLYLAGGEIVTTAREVVGALGDEARELLEKIRDADTVLERLGRAF